MRLSEAAPARRSGAERLLGLAPPAEARQQASAERRRLRLVVEPVRGAGLGQQALGFVERFRRAAARLEGQRPAAARRGGCAGAARGARPVLGHAEALQRLRAATARQGQFTERDQRSRFHVGAPRPAGLAERGCEPRFRVAGPPGAREGPAPFQQDFRAEPGFAQLVEQRERFLEVDDGGREVAACARQHRRAAQRLRERAGLCGRSCGSDRPGRLRLRFARKSQRGERCGPRPAQPRGIPSAEVRGEQRERIVRKPDGRARQAIVDGPFGGSGEERQRRFAAACRGQVVASLLFGAGSVRQLFGAPRVQRGARRRAGQVERIGRGQPRRKRDADPPRDVDDAPHGTAGDERIERLGVPGRTRLELFEFRQRKRPAAGDAERGEQRARLGALRQRHRDGRGPGERRSEGRGQRQFGPDASGRDQRLGKPGDRPRRSGGRGGEFLDPRRRQGGGADHRRQRAAGVGRRQRRERDCRRTGRHRESGASGGLVVAVSEDDERRERARRGLRGEREQDLARGRIGQVGVIDEGNDGEAGESRDEALGAGRAVVRRRRGALVARQRVLERVDEPERPGRHVARADEHGRAGGGVGLEQELLEQPRAAGTRRAADRPEAALLAGGRSERVAPRGELRPAADQLRGQRRGERGGGRRGRAGQRREAPARVLGGRRAARRVLLEQREDQLLEQRRDAAREVPRRSRGDGEVGARDLPGVGAQERILPGDDAVEHAAQRVEVGASVECRAAQRLGGERGRRSAEHAALRVPRARDEPEVHQPHRRGVARELVADENVRRLDVAVNETAAVQRAERVEQRVGDARDGGRVRAGERNVDRPAGDEVHREPRRLGGPGSPRDVRRVQHAELVDRDQVRVAERRQDVELAVERADQLGRVGDPLRPQELQRENAPGGPVPDLEHLPRGAGPEAPLDLEAAGEQRGGWHAVVMRHSVAGRNTPRNCCSPVRSGAPPAATPSKGTGRQKKRPSEEGRTGRGKGVSDSYISNRHARPRARGSRTGARACRSQCSGEGRDGSASLTRRVSLTGRA